MLHTPLDPDKLSETLVRVTRAILLRDYKRNMSLYHTEPLTAIATLAQDIGAYASNVLPVWLLSLHYDMAVNNVTANQSLEGMRQRASRGYSWRKVCYGGYKANRTYKGGK